MKFRFLFSMPCYSLLDCGNMGPPIPLWLSLWDPIHLWIFLLLTGPNSPFPTELIFYVPHSARTLEMGRAELVCQESCLRTLWLHINFNKFNSSLLPRNVARCWRHYKSFRKSFLIPNSNFLWILLLVR